MNVVFESAGYACFTCRDRSLSLCVCVRVCEHLPFPPPLPPLHHRHSKVIRNELNAGVKENGYQRGVNRDKDSLRDPNKYVDKIKKEVLTIRPVSHRTLGAKTVVSSEIVAAPKRISKCQP
jgi:hypothetical protein